MPAPHPPLASQPSFQNDLLFAYGAAAAKMGSWLIIVAIMMRHDRPGLAMLALVRGTLGLLTYTALGIGSGMINLVAEQRAANRTASVSLLSPYSNGLALAGVSGAVGLILLLIYANGFEVIHRLPAGVFVPYLLIMGVGIGTILRLMSDAPAGVLQAARRLGTDSKCVILSEIAWVPLSLAAWRLVGLRLEEAIGFAYALSAALLLLLRLSAAARLTGRLMPDRSLISTSAIGRLLGFGSLIVLAQLADFLYAPTDYILINRLLDPLLVAVYVPAVQIDSGLLLMVSGLSTVLLPRSATAFHAGDGATIRRYYLRGTLASFVMLLIATGLVWWLSPLLFQLWLGSDQPMTRAILPLVLVHTVIGGSGSVGRSILLGMGKAAPYAASVLLGGISNVSLSILFVWGFGWGLKGIVLATIIAVGWRCLIWQPLYLIRTLSKSFGPGFQPVVRELGSDQAFSRS